MRNCVSCNIIMLDSHPYVFESGRYFCGDCAYKIGLIDGFKLAKRFYYFADAYYVEVLEEIANVYNKSAYLRKIKREKASRNNKRNSPEYKIFRKLVFQRDDYTCQICFKRGGELNAHHIKGYKNYKKLRTVVSNGVTLCEKCHKKEHRRVNEMV